MRHTRLVLLSLWLGALALPADVLPPEGAALNRIHVRFQWEPVPAAVAHELEVVLDDGSPDPFTTAPVVAASLPAPAVHADITAGLAFGRDYAWRVRGVEAGGPLPWGATRRMSTGALPAWMPVFSATYDPNAAAAIEPGVTIMPLRDNATIPVGVMVAVDRDGQVVWFLEAGTRVSDPRLLPNGNVLFISDYRGFETDLDGNVVWASPDDPNLLVHHELFPLPGGNRLALLYDYVEVERFAPGDVDRNAAVALDDLLIVLADFGCDAWPCPGDVDIDLDTDFDDLLHVLANFGRVGTELQKWRSDRVVEFAPDNQIVWEFDLPDHLAPTDFDFDAMAIKRAAGGPPDDSYDWTHCNAAVYNAADNSVYISVRNLSQIWRVDYATREVVYRMGFQMPSGAADFGEGLFSYEHAPELQPNGNILLFDNGNRRDRQVHAGGSTETISKAVELELLGDPPTAAQIAWEWETPFYSAALGDADRLAGGNTLVVNGTDNRVTEVDPAGNIVWRLDTAPASIYRAQRAATLHPAAP